MKAVVVYESLWGNTAAIAAAIAEGIGDARALTTAEATPEALADAGLLVAGSPVLGFSAPTEAMRKNIASNPSGPAPDLAHPSIREWLAGLGQGTGRAASFETRLRFSPGGATGTIDAGLRGAGYDVESARRFFVAGRYGPLRDGELERAREWGAELARW